MSFPERIVERRRRLGFPSGFEISIYKEGNDETTMNEDRNYARPGSTPTRSRFNANANANDGREVNTSSVTIFLNENKGFLKKYIETHMDTDELESWVLEKRRKVHVRPSFTLSQESFDLNPGCCQGSQHRYHTRDIITLQKTLTNLVKTQTDRLPLLYELANVIGAGIGAEGIALHCIRGGGKELALYVPNVDVPSNYQLVPEGPVEEGSTISAFVAHSKEALFLSNIYSDDRFPLGVCAGREDTEHQTIICLPITLPSEDLLGVFQFVRGWDHDPFTKSDMQVALALTAWVGVSMHSTQVNLTLEKQLDLEDFLLEVSRVIFDDITQLDAVSEKIMGFTKELVQAERCALFLYNHKKEELYSNLFDEGQEENGKPIFRKSDKIRFPITKGIAGHVARSREIVNIKDAYKDDRFNREVDKKTGFVTRNILCMPIVAKDEVVGVIQMINKKSGNCFNNAAHRTPQATAEE